MSREGLASAKAVCPKTQSGPPRNDTEDHILVTCIVLIRLRVGICQQGEMPGERLKWGISHAGETELMPWLGKYRIWRKIITKPTLNDPLRQPPISAFDALSAYGCKHMILIMSAQLGDRSIDLHFGSRGDTLYELPDAFAGLGVGR